MAKIYRVSRMEEDERLIRGVVCKEAKPKTRSMDFNGAIVKKPWGYEYLVFENGFVAVWMLHIVRKRKTSMHAHLNKKTALILLSGSANCAHLDESFGLEAMDAAIIPEGAFHCTEAYSQFPIQPQSENGIWIMEIESPPVKTDLIRFRDAYGRQGTSYEGQENMVFEPQKCLKLAQPGAAEAVFRRDFLNYTFSIIRGEELGRAGAPSPDALVSVLSLGTGAGSSDSALSIGEVSKWKDFSGRARGEDLSGCVLMLIERQASRVKVSDYIFDFIAGLGLRQVFAVCGGGAMHLVDSLGRNPRLEYIATHHEQAAAMAAEAYARISGGPGACLVTSGPGGTNTITGLMGAWIDSIPVIFISGQVTRDTLIADTGLRQFGIQETDTISLVKPFTKYAVTVTDASLIKFHLQKALFLARQGRPGPVWLDIPLDVQGELVDSGSLPGFERPAAGNGGDTLDKQVKECLRLLKEAKRPVIISGYGIRLSGAQEKYRQLVERLRIPVISSWISSDLIASDHPLYIGRSGIMGDRAGNFTVQNADLLLIIGSRMSIPQVGYNYRNFAREAKKIMVDIDPAELNKPSLKVDLPIRADCGDFISRLLRQLDSAGIRLEAEGWLARCQQWKQKYPVVLEEYSQSKEGINSFYFIDVLSAKLGPDAAVVTDMGTSFTCTMQAFKVKQGQRLFNSSGLASMGFGLPGAIGACFARGRKRTICISGDGGLQMNIQELQTLVHYKLPVIIFYLNNAGYLTIKLMQQNHFGRYVGSERSSGLSCPDILKVAAAYGIAADRVRESAELPAKLGRALSAEGPYICEVIMPENQPLIPRVSSLKRPDGRIVSKPLEDLYPFLSRKEFRENMIVKPIEVLEEEC